MPVMQNTHGSEVLSTEEMREFERLNFIKKKSYNFMERAGYEVFKFIKANYKKKQSIIVLCGPGNNGGDGFVVARHLMNNLYKTEVYTYKDKKSYSGDALNAVKKFKGATKKIKFLNLKKNFFYLISFNSAIAVHFNFLFFRFVL